VASNIEVVNFVPVGLNQKANYAYLTL